MMVDLQRQKNYKMRNYTNLLRRKAINSNRNGKYTYTEVNSIKSKLCEYLIIDDKEFVVLYKPNNSYWVLLTGSSILYFLNNIVREIFYEEIKNKEVYFHYYKNYYYDNEMILSDHIKIERKKDSELIILPIEILSVFSFSEPINFILTKLN